MVGSDNKANIRHDNLAECLQMFCINIHLNFKTMSTLEMITHLIASRERSAMCYPPLIQSVQREAFFLSSFLSSRK